MSKNILEIKNLKSSFFTYNGEVKAVRGVSFNLKKNDILGIVGESGSGKSVTAMSIIRLLQFPGRIVGGDVLFDGESLLNKTNDEMRKIRGKDIAMVFQDPMTSLNPTLKVGLQISERIRAFEKISRNESYEKAEEMLRQVGIPSPRERLKSYPFEMSGGMRQRVMLAIALINNPKVLIADEPTTALDVTIQKQVLKLIKKLSTEINSSIIIITHDLGVIAETCTKTIVMYGGLIMEEGTVEEIFYNPSHPYTEGLQKSMPKLDDKTGNRLYSISGTPPNLIDPPKGCPFADRCEYAMKICKQIQPEYKYLSETHRSMCWLHDERSASKKYK